MVFDVVEATETDDHYTVILSVRPQGNFDGTPGQEQFVVGKDGTIAVRQILSPPAQTSVSTAGIARNGGRFPVLPMATGMVIVGIIAAVGAILLVGNSGGDRVPVDAVAPTETPAAPTRPTAPAETLAPPTPSELMISISPTSVSSGNTVTLAGTDFPPNTTVSSLTIGGADAMPSGDFVTDAEGRFSQVIEVPAAVTGGSLPPGIQIISIKVGNITATSSEFSIPNPSIVITPAEGSTEDVVTITGVGFNSLDSVRLLNFGASSALPSPAPITNIYGEITTEVWVPQLNPGSYTVTMGNGTRLGESWNFSASAPFFVSTGGKLYFEPPNPSIVITPAEGAAGDYVIITGVGFKPSGNISLLNFGDANALPSPAPRATVDGEITAMVMVPLLNPGSYTVTISNGAEYGRGDFSASATFQATSAK